VIQLLLVLVRHSIYMRNRVIVRKLVVMMASVMVCKQGLMFPAKLSQCSEYIIHTLLVAHDLNEDIDGCLKE
jgi:hypothetical protein